MAGRENFLLNWFLSFYRDRDLLDFHLLPVIHEPDLARIVRIDFLHNKVLVIGHNVGDPPGDAAVVPKRYVGESGYGCTYDV